MQSLIPSPIQQQLPQSYILTCLLKKGRKEISDVPCQIPSGKLTGEASRKLEEGTPARPVSLIAHVHSVSLFRYRNTTETYQQGADGLVIFKTAVFTI